MIVTYKPDIDDMVQKYPGGKILAVEGLSSLYNMIITVFLTIYSKM